MNTWLKTIILTTALCLLTTLANGSVILFDMDSGWTFDLTDTLTQITQIETIDAVTAVDVDAAGGDEWLVVEGDGQLVFLDLATFTELFRLPEQDLRDLFGLPAGSGVCSTFSEPSSNHRCLLYRDTLYGDWYTVNLSTAFVGAFQYLSLPQWFYCGFSYSADDDIGLLTRSLDGYWWYEPLPDRTPIDLDLTPLFGAAPQHLTEVEFGTGATAGRYLLATTEGSTPGTPTPTPTPTSGPGTPTTTPTPGSASYSVLVVNAVDDETIDRVDASDYSIEKGLAITGLSPNQILRHQNELFVVNSLSHSITVYDPYTVAMKREMTTGVGNNPFMMAFVDNDHFYVTQFNLNFVTKINATNGDIVTQIPMPENLPTDPGTTTVARPQGITVVDGIAYVACANLDNSFVAGGPGIIVQIDTTTDQVTGWIESGGRNCVGVHYDANRSDWIWITNAGDYSSGSGYDRNGTIAIYSLSQGMVTDNIPVNDAPYELVLGSERAYYSSAADGLVGRLDLGSLSLLEPISLPNAGHGLNFVSGMKLGSDGRLWVLEFNHDKLFTLNTFHNDDLVHEVTVGHGPDDLIIVE